MAWTVIHPGGTVADQLDRPPSATREVLIHRIDRPTLVLGSTQAPDVVDRAALAARGVALARRRSGGGAVLLEPGAAVWIDVVVPVGDPLWDDDLGRSFRWFGRTWVAALADLGIPAVLADPRPADRFARIACFAGVGHGEVVVGDGAVKVVGLSQRRTRAVARLSSVALLEAPSDHLLGLLRLDRPDRDELAGYLARPGVEALAALEPEAVTAAVVRRLPD